MSLGLVWFTFVRVTVTWVTSPFRLLTLMADGYGVALLKSLMTIALLLEYEAGILPSVKLKSALLSTVLPSCSCRVAVMVCPLVPLAVNVKGREADGPCAVSTPYDCGPLGLLIPLVVARSVAIRLAVLVPLALRKANNSVTISPGSMTPSTGPLSEVSATPAGMIKLPSVSAINRVALVGLTITALPTGLLRFSVTVWPPSIK